MITERERQILGWIRENPSITQKELAEKAQISRSSVAVHISNLMRKGAIRGRRYILEESPYIVSIGASRVDVIGWPEMQHTLGSGDNGSDSHRGIVRTVVSGTAHNIAQTLAHLDCPVRLVSVFGGDDEGERLIASCKRDGIDISESMTARGMESASNVFLTRPDGTRQLVLSDSKAFDLLSPDYLAEHLATINRAAICIVESSVPQASRDFLWKSVQVPMAYVSSTSRNGIPTETDLSRPDLIKIDISTLEALVERILPSLMEIKIASSEVLARGPRAVFVSLEDGGLFCLGQGEEAHLPWVGGPLPPSGEFQDALSASIIWGWIQGFTAKKCAQAGLVAAAYHANARGATRVTLDSKSLRARLGAESD
ncbi:PfkB family carbohydrate kinase [Atopobium sp. oral taxon 810]|uniref:PfkB family carbohydrate kinase n=1 Tax=Atopobium sp. oral taxon 810 TaxID=712158 RepID=UPI00039621AC|nr:PfkB family carbohydrate kinase [Atopobium sp. oral taxon 810]ERI05016.1 HTH domain protein [Atopobium sp. oral taxon 810 str. F0209]